MPDQMKNVLVITVVIFILILLWAVSIGITYWDAVSRRKLSGIETAAWVALVVLIPGIGFAAYLFTRLLGRALSPGQPVVSQTAAGNQSKTRVLNQNRGLAPSRRLNSCSLIPQKPSPSLMGQGLKRECENLQ